MQNYILDEIDLLLNENLESIIDDVVPILQRQNALLINYESLCNQKIILTQPSSKIYPEIECPICFHHDRQSIPLLCGHCFCQSCITEIIKESPLKCPLCREVQMIGSLHDLVSIRQEGNK